MHLFITTSPLGNCSKGSSKEAGGHSPSSQRSGSQIKFLVSVAGHLGRKFSVYVWVLYQNLHIWAYDLQNVFFVTDSPLETPATTPHWLSEVEVVEPPLKCGIVM